MTDHLQTPDEWLLQQYDDGDARPCNHVRPLFQLVEDGRDSSEEYPRWSGQASWPDPPTYADLDRLEANAARTAELAYRLTVPATRRTA